MDADHPDLRGNVLPGFNTWDGAKGTRGLRPRKSHGTSVASLIAGHGHGPGNRDGVLGIAPKAKILPINIDDPKFAQLSPASIATAMRLAVDAKADVIVVALGGSTSREQEAAVAYADAHGVPVIAGAGNREPGIAFVSYPAAIPHVIAVTALERSGKLASYSVAGREVDVAAPADRFPAAIPGGGYEAFFGTSAAAAIAGGAAALILSRYPSEHLNKFTQRMLWTTRDAGAPGFDEQYGWGTLDLVGALTREPVIPAEAKRPTATPPSGFDRPIAASPGPGAALLWLGLLGFGVVTALLVVGGVLFVVYRRRRVSGAGAPRGSP